MNLFSYIINHRDENITVLVNDKKIYSGKAVNFYNLRTKNPELYSNVSRHINDFTLNESLNQFELKLTEPTVIAYLVYSPDRSYECEIRKCDKATKCSLYRQNMCMAANRLAVGCPELYKSVTKAGKNSAKGIKLKDEYSEKQRNLPVVCEPFSGYFYEVDDRCYFQIPCIALYRGLTSKKIKISDWFPGEDYETLSNELLPTTITCTKDEFINDYWPVIESANPRSLFTNAEITKYQGKIVPRLKLDILRTDPELALKLNIKDSDINYVGKFARVNTLNANITGWSYDYEGKKKYQIHWDGEYITILNPPALFSFSTNVGTFISGECKFIPSDKLCMKVEDNSWVNNKTIIENR